MPLAGPPRKILVERSSSGCRNRSLCPSRTKPGAAYQLEIRVSGESFLCPPGPWSDVIGGAVEQVTGRPPALGTTGGTSDARFIKDHAPVAELGLLNATAHKVDERVDLDDLETLSAIYEAVLDGTFPR